MRHLFLVLFLSFIHISLHAQDNDKDLDLKVGSTFLLNPNGLGEELPFWMHVNQDGRVDQRSANALAYADASKMIYEKNNWKFKTGGSIISRYSESPTVFFNKLYAKASFHTFTLAAGKFLDPLALKEDELSTGSFMVSRNTNPVPRLAFYTDGFTSIPGTQGIVRYNAYFSHGWFEPNRYVKNAYLHQKFFYLNIKYAFFDAIGGIVHNVQWAGESRDQAVGKLPSGWDTFTEVVFARGSSDKNAQPGERSNAVGNSVAAYDFSLGLFFPSFDMRMYRLFYLEDKVSTRFRSPWDGIWGLTVKPKNSSFIKNFIWEHINTKRQDSFGFEPRGTASYYNNFIYRTGWTYNRRVLGNPLLLSDGSIDRPIFNNIIIGHHFGLAGNLSDNWQYTFRYTFTRNYGEVNDQIIERLPREDCPGIHGRVCAVLRPLSSVKKQNNSISLELRSSFTRFEELYYSFLITADFGELNGDRLGLGLNLEYQF